MRIIHAIPVYAPAWQYGGPVLSVSRLCEGLVAEGVQIEVITTNAGLPDLPQSDLEKKIEYNGVTVTYFPVDRKRGSISSRALEAALPGALSNFDLLHLSAIWQPLGVPIQMSARMKGVPVLHSLRGALSPYSFRHGWWKKVPYYMVLERRWLQQAQGLHVTSEQERRELSLLNLKAPKFLLPNPVDLKGFCRSNSQRTAFRGQLGLTEDEPLLLICGRQHHKKGLELLPEILGKCLHYPWKLLIVGSDEDGSGRRLRLQISRGGFSSRVIELSMLPSHELNKIYNAADLLLLPSRHENFGNVVIEALACGCAVAISDRTGVSSDLLTRAPEGYGVVLPRLKQSWEGWLSSWLTRPARATPEVTAWVKGHYSQQAVARKAIEIYDKILQTQRQRNTWT